VISNPAPVPGPSLWPSNCPWCALMIAWRWSPHAASGAVSGAGRVATVKRSKQLVGYGGVESFAVVGHHDPAPVRFCRVAAIGYDALAGCRCVAGRCPEAPPEPLLTGRGRPATWRAPSVASRVRLIREPSPVVGGPLTCETLVGVTDSGLRPLRPSEALRRLGSPRSMSRSKFGLCCGTGGYFAAVRAKPKAPPHKGQGLWPAGNTGRG